MARLTGDTKTTPIFVRQTELAAGWADGRAAINRPRMANFDFGEIITGKADFGLCEPVIANKVLKMEIMRARFLIAGAGSSAASSLSQNLASGVISRRPSTCPRALTRVKSRKARKTASACRCETSKVRFQSPSAVSQKSPKSPLCRARIFLQRDALAEAGWGKIFIEQMSGAVTDRPALRDALEFARSGDTLIVWKLDRLARSMKQLIETIEKLRVRGIGFRSLTEALDTTTAQGRLVFHMFGALAEFERVRLAQRRHRHSHPQRQQPAERTVPAHSGRLLRRLFG
jgi:hypothetical protein